MTICDFAKKEMNPATKVPVWATLHARVEVDMCLACRTALERKARQAEVDFYTERKGPKDERN